jgi:chemosensory pili system protein ChpA (sensor histidine kinase/response regulator)
VFANIDRDVLIGFVEEVRANLSVIVGAVETLKKDGAAPGALQDAHRMFHTTKGASSMIGFAALSHIAYYAEEAIEDVMAGQLPLTPEVIETLLHTVGQIESYVGGLAAGTLAERPIVETTVAKFRRLRKLPETGDAAAVLELRRLPRRRFRAAHRRRRPISRCCRVAFCRPIRFCDSRITLISTER